MRSALLCGLALVFTAAPVVASDPLAEATRTLQDAGISTRDEGLLDYFRQRTVSLDEKQAARLIEQLGSRSFAVREEASRTLARLGPRVVRLLEPHRDHTDLEIRRRVNEAIDAIISQATPRLGLAAARLLAERQPASAVPVLLDYLPSADDDEVAAAVRETLASITARQVKPDRALLAALTDDEPSRRAGAGVALARPGRAADRQALAKLLEEADPEVCLPVALEMTGQGRREAVPVLIRAFATLPRGKLWQVEDVLYHLAGDQAPTVALGETVGSRAAFVKAWLAWWEQHGKDVDLASLGRQAFLDRTLIVLLDDGVVMELDGEDEPRFKIEKVGFPLDAQMLSGDRVLLAEHGASRVTERARDGTILWQKDVASPLVAKRMPNGRTFIATREALFEVDREGRETFRYARPDNDTFMRANRLPTGELLFITHRQQRLTWLDAQGKQLASFPANVHTSGGRIDVQPNGNVLIPQMYNNRVAEYDRQGKAVRDFRVEQPISAVRLDNGHTLVTSMSQMRAIEFDLTGKEVWEFKHSTRVTRALRR